MWLITLAGGSNELIRFLYLWTADLFQSYSTLGSHLRFGLFDRCYFLLIGHVGLEQIINLNAERR